MTAQSSFMILSSVKDTKIEELTTLLSSMNSTIPAHADPKNDLLPFGRFPRLHFARFVIIEAHTADEIEAFGIAARPWQPTLAFFGEIDGDIDSFFTELEDLASVGLRKIFALCEKFPKEEENLQQWLKKNNTKSNANYVNWIGRTVKHIHEDDALHQSLAAYLREHKDDIDKNNTLALRQKLLSHVEMEKYAGRLTLTAEEKTPLKWKMFNFIHMIGVPLVLVLLSPLFLIMAPFFFIRLRMLERSDPELFIRPEHSYLEKLTIQEDWSVSNQYNVFGDIKPGVFRLLTLKFILFLVDYFSRHVYKRGFLARIKTIHFARWVLLDDNKRAFFASNYDGSHESYMDDFINKVGWGLNLIFSHAVPYPKTSWLIKQGAYREQQFKYTQRLHQLPTEVWYKAYPDLTNTDLARNSRIRKGVEIRQSSVDEIREWLHLI
ncbi:MAG: hypothetical protein COB07_05480 [Sulfurovum sp.]|nr:MAG: hypothetical protein COB07_05480 [Sulfurovum sp.]